MVGGNFQTCEKSLVGNAWMLQENLVDFNPFHRILYVTHERDRSNFPAKCTVHSFPNTCRLLM